MCDERPQARGRSHCIFYLYLSCSAAWPSIIPPRWSSAKTFGSQGTELSGVPAVPVDWSLGKSGSLCWGGQEPVPWSAGRAGMGHSWCTESRWELQRGCGRWLSFSRQSVAGAVALPAGQPCGQCCCLCSGPGGLWATPQFQGCSPETPSAAFPSSLPAEGAGGSAFALYRMGSSAPEPARHFRGTAGSGFALGQGHGGIRGTRAGGGAALVPKQF